ncbi:hypothetical protein PBOR_06300 [Paenibacillus borealis]|uniref:Uncharacterized protein n=1 Tax=Paenibacillus borealis TaxID=160799 RepID=A0A089LBR0_PAEBO|nr:hypothetical protein PBOR_06300 [Paenibacillus borealis]
MISASGEMNGAHTHERSAPGANLPIKIYVGRPQNENVVRSATRNSLYRRIPNDCCTKYKNFLAWLLSGEEMLPFLQQSWIRAAILKKLLYFMQDSQV